VPQERFFYSRIITWIGTDSLLPLQRNYYALNSELWKMETFEDVSVIKANKFLVVARGSIEKTEHTLTGR